MTLFLERWVGMWGSTPGFKLMEEEFGLQLECRDGLPENARQAIYSAQSKFPHL